jgi:hypothetical protein
MKKKRFPKVLGSIYLVLLAALTFTVVRAPEAAPAPSPAPMEKVQNYIKFGVGTSGPPNIIGGAFCAVVSKHSDIKASTQYSGGLPSFPLLATGDIDMISYGGPLFMSGYLGQGVKATKIRLLSSAGAPSLAINVICTRPDTGIKTIAGLRGKKVSAEQPSIPNFAVVMDALLKHNGMTRNDVVWLKSSASQESVDGLIEKRLDAAIKILGAKTMEIQEAVGIYYIPLNPGEQDAVCKAIAMQAYTVPKGVFGVEVDTPTVAEVFGIITRLGMNDITAYTATKALYEHIDDFHKVNALCKGFKLENAMNQMLLPMHPGAIRYYKEKGVWTAAHEAKQQTLLAKEKEIFKD